MSVRKRQIVFLILALTFAAAAPLVILYTAGYRYNVKKKIIEKTGALVLDSEPERARILINGEDAHMLSPARFPRLLPGVYLVRMEKEGHHAWEKMLSVESKRTTFATEVVFFRSNLPEVFLPHGFPAPGGMPATSTYEADGLRYLTRKTAEGTLVLQKDKNRPGAPREVAFLKSGSYEFLPGPDGFLTILDADRTRLYLLRPEEREPIVLEERAALASWSPSGRKLLISDGFDLQIFEPTANKLQFVTRYGKEIKKALWMESEAHVLLSFDDSLRGLELDSRGSRYAPTLAESKNISDFYLDKGEESVYFTAEGETGRVSYKLRIR